MRLVKDDDATFHFQWAEPLKEERIILVRLSGVIFDPKYKAEYSHEEELLVYFPPGTVVSYAIDRPRALEYTSMAILGRIDSVEILPAALRETVLPADVWKIGEDGLFRGHGKRILREHPFFRDYRVAPLSRITFPTLEPTDETGTQSERRPSSILPSFETGD